MDADAEAVGAATSRPLSLLLAQDAPIASAPGLVRCDDAAVPPPLPIELIHCRSLMRSTSAL